MCDNNFSIKLSLFSKCNLSCYFYRYAIDHVRLITSHCRWLKAFWINGECRIKLKWKCSLSMHGWVYNTIFYIIQYTPNRVRRLNYVSMNWSLFRPLQEHILVYKMLELRDCLFRVFIIPAIINLLKLSMTHFPITLTPFSFPFQHSNLFISICVFCFVFFFCCFDSKLFNNTAQLYSMKKRNTSRTRNDQFYDSIYLFIFFYFYMSRISLK